MQQLGASNARLVQKEPFVQPKHCQCTFFVRMVLIQMLKARAIASFVTQALDVQVLEWNLPKCVPTEHTATPLVL